MMYEAVVPQQEASTPLPSMHEWLILRATHGHLIDCRAHLLTADLCNSP